MAGILDMGLTAASNLASLQALTHANMRPSQPGVGVLGGGVGPARERLTEAQREKMVEESGFKRFLFGGMSPQDFNEQLAVDQAATALDQEQALRQGMFGFREGLQGQTLSPLEGGRAQQRAMNLIEAGGSPADVAAMAQNPQFNPVLAASIETATEAARVKSTDEARKLAAQAYKAETDAAAAARDFNLFDMEAAIIEREKTKQANQLELRRLQAEELGIPVPEQGQGYVVDPLTGRQTIGYLPGTPEYTEQNRKLSGAFNTLNLVNGIVRDINDAGTSGTDVIGSRAARVDSKRSQLFSSIFQSRGMGAPQGPDIELLERGIPDTTGIMANLRGAVTGGAGGQKAAALQGYQSLQEEAQQIVTDLLLENPYLIDQITPYDLGQLHPDSDLYKTIEKLQSGNQ